MNKILKYISFSLLSFFSTFNFAFACIDSPEDALRKSLIYIGFILITLIGNIYIIFSKNKKNKSILKIIISVLLFSLGVFVLWFLYSMTQNTFCA